MAKDNNLTDFLTDIADAIRAKKGTTNKINPQDFRKEIESIEGGGSSSIEYLDVSGIDAPSPLLLQNAIYVKGYEKETGIKLTGCTVTYVDLIEALMSINIQISAVAIDFQSPIKTEMGGQTQDIKVIDVFIQSGITPDELAAIPRLTKEQFYSFE